MVTFTQTAAICRGDGTKEVNVDTEPAEGGVEDGRVGVVICASPGQA